MKLSLIAACCLIVGCATGVEPEDTEPQTPVVTKVPTPKPVEPQPEPTPTHENDYNCQVESYWVDNCLVTKAYCDGKLVDVDIKCTLGRPLFPWEYIPDPPYDRNNKNE